MDFNQLETSSSPSTSVDSSRSYDSRQWTSGWRHEARKCCASIKSYYNRLSRSKEFKEVAAITSSFLAVVALIMSVHELVSTKQENMTNIHGSLFLYHVLFTWYPSSQYSLTGHNFISEHEASNVDGLSRWTEDFSRSVIPIM